VTVEKAYTLTTPAVEWRGRLMCGLKCGFISVSASCVRVDGCVSASDSESIFLSGKRNTVTWSRSVWEWETSNGEDSDATSTDWSVRTSPSRGAFTAASHRGMLPQVPRACTPSRGDWRATTSAQLEAAALSSDSASDAAGHGRWLAQAGTAFRPTAPEEPPGAGPRPAPCRWQAQ
jgi:hypothetical protein